MVSDAVNVNKVADTRAIVVQESQRNLPLDVTGDETAIIIVWIIPRRGFIGFAVRSDESVFSNPIADFRLPLWKLIQVVNLVNRNKLSFVNYSRSRTRDTDWHEWKMKARRQGKRAT
jgi:hypothetical protein